MRYALLAILLLASIFCPLLAAEAANTVPPVPEGAPSWLSWVWPILFTVVVPFAIRWLRSGAKERESAAKDHDLSSVGKMIENRRAFLDARVLPFLQNTAADLIESRLPAVIADAADGGGFDWRSHVKGVKDELLSQAKAKFSAEGIDIVENIGAEYLDKLLDRVVTKVLPFVPEAVRSAAAGVADKYSDKLATLVVEKGVGYARDRWLSGGRKAVDEDVPDGEEG